MSAPVDVRRQCRAVRAIVGRYRRCRYLADDLEQAGHLGYCRAMTDERYDPQGGASLETWAFRRATQAVYGAYRAERRHQVRVDRLRERLAVASKANPHGLDPLDALVVRDAVAALLDPERDLIIAWFWENTPPKEYARERGIGEWTAYRIRDRALDQLARAIGGV